MINIKRILFLIFIMFFSRVKAQIIYSTTGNPSLMSLSGKFVEIDSQFYIIPKLDIYKKNFKIRIPQKTSRCCTASSPSGPCATSHAVHMSARQ